MVVDEIEGVVKLLPVPAITPPLALSYQLMIPALAVAPKFTVPVPHRLPGVVPVILGMSLIVATTAVLAVVVHEPLVAST